MLSGGGLSAVIWTDFVQTILMIIGAVWLMVASFQRVGGYEKLIDDYRVSVPEPEYVAFYNDTVSGTMKACGAATVEEDKFMHFLRPVDVGSGDLPWTGILTGMTIR